MPRPTEDRSRLRLGGHLSLAVAGLAVAVVDGPAAMAFAAAFSVVGLLVLGIEAAGQPSATLSRRGRRLWLVAVLAAVPYGLATAPASPEAAAVGAPLAHPAVLAPVTALLWSLGFGAVGTTVFGTVVTTTSGDRRTPEERVLDERAD